MGVHDRTGSHPTLRFLYPSWNLLEYSIGGKFIYINFKKKKIKEADEWVETRYVTDTDSTFIGDESANQFNAHTCTSLILINCFFFILLIQQFKSQK